MPDDGRPFSNNLLDLAPPDIAWFQERSDIILVPIGSLEQHGAHLPLGTDTITALEVSRRAALKADVPYTAPFWLGYSPQHMRETESAVGTITLRGGSGTMATYNLGQFGVSNDDVRVYSALPDLNTSQQILIGGAFR